MTHGDVVAFATQYFPPVLDHDEFKSIKPSGLLLSKLTLQGFMRSYGPSIGEAFYNTLAEEGTPLLRGSPLRSFLVLFASLFRAFFCTACFRVCCTSRAVRFEIVVRVV